MEKREKVTRTIEEHKHYFYCDSCYKFLGEVKEYEDGYYPILGKFELKFRVADKRYRLDKCLCDECKNNLVNNMQSILKGMGFEEY